MNRFAPSYFVLAIAAVCALAACNVTDDRPETLAYITEAILAPSCGTAECHSAMKREKGYAFDTVENAQDSIANGELVEVCATPPCVGAPADSYLLTVITSQDVEGNRMPLDQPLANKSIYLIGNWITNGAEGYTPPTAPTDGE
jgi:hypothetical protein